jgi:hypothetical protein
LYVPLPFTAAAPTVVPPLVQVVGAAAWGPKTLKVMVPPALLVALPRAELIDAAPIGVLVASVAGADADAMVAFSATSVNAAERAEELLPGSAAVPVTVTV